MFHDELPVYKASYDLFLRVFLIIGKFPKQYKYTVGEKMKNEVLELMMGIYRANSNFEKRKENIEKTIEHMRMIQILSRLSKDLKIIDLKKFIELSVNIEDISKQLYSWKK